MDDRPLRLRSLRQPAVAQLGLEAAPAGGPAPPGSDQGSDPTLTIRTPRGHPSSVLLELFRRNMMALWTGRGRKRRMPPVMITVTARTSTARGCPGSPCLLNSQCARPGTAVASWASPLERQQLEKKRLPSLGPDGSAYLLTRGGPSAREAALPQAMVRRARANRETSTTLNPTPDRRPSGPHTKVSM